MDVDVLQKSRNYDWLLCIFFSVDIEGATAYKTKMRHQNGDEDWCLLFERFYKEFPGTFDHAYLSLSSSQAPDAITKIIRPTLWKFVGDEILFYAPLTDPSQTLEHVRAFRQALIDYNKNILQQYGVSCKGTVWLAGFPINNRIVLLDDKHKDKPIIDFVGASIDIGFRLTKFSSSRKLVISLDLLWLLAESEKDNHEKVYSTFLKDNVKYSGRHELKGVLSDKSYPIFWIDSCAKSPVEDDFLPDHKKCNLNSIITFCEEFSCSVDSSIFVKPFIVGDSAGQIKEDQVRKDFREQRDSLRTYKEGKSMPTGKDTAPLEKVGSDDSPVDTIRNLKPPV
ncbi:MAG: hypothetical protein LBE12_06480 [Planctomycetaceae bacterium]|jgi:hypothetical protein|nr:hypothetical protein [Planctomycetaceae bacterium]